MKAFTGFGRRNLSIVATLATLTLLSACGGSGGGDDKTTTTDDDSYTIGGSVTGLGNTLVLLHNSGEELSLTDSGNFTFKVEANKGDSYSVSIKTQPSGHVCTVTSGSGTVASDNVSNITVTCIADQNPNGYYNAGTLKDGAGADIGANVQAMVYDKRLLLVSFDNDVLYEGQMDISGVDFTTTVTIYQNGLSTGTASMTGEITEGSKITGTLGGTGIGAGSFIVHYADTNTTNLANDQRSQLVTDGGNPTWEANVAGSGTPYMFDYFNSEFSPAGAPDVGTFAGCGGTGNITPLTGTALYSLPTFRQLSCTDLSIVGNDFNVLTTPQSLANSSLLFIGTMPGYALYGVFQ